jgi:periplasmic protein TonB
MNTVRLPAAGAALLVNGLAIAGLMSLAAPQSIQQLIMPIQVALITLPQTPITPPEPLPVVKPPEPLPIKKPVLRPIAKPTPVAPIPPAPVVAARPVEEPRPASITAEPAPAEAPVAPKVAEPVADASPPPRVDPPPSPQLHIGPRIDASWSGNSTPPYPSLAMRMGEEGEVRLDVQVGADGAVLDVKLKKSSGSRLLDQTAIETVRKWRFKPATVDGKAVAEWYYNWRWNFKLES